MGQFYIAGEIKNRPGSYQRYINRGKNIGVGATDNSVAIPIQANWGPVGVVTEHESISSITKTYGTSGTVDAALALFEGGAPKVYCIRLNKATNSSSGDDAASGTLTLPSSGDGVVTITSKYPGTKAIKVQTRVKVEDVSKEIVIYDGDTKVETFTFASGTDVDEAANLVKAVSVSSYITATKIGSATTTTVPVQDITALTGGKDPSITTESYSEAFNKLEPYKFTHIVLDCVTVAVQTALRTWLNRVYEEGKLCVAVIGGDNADTSFAEKVAAAVACNDKKAIYSGIWGRDADGNVIDGYTATALVAGAIANTPSNQSIVHSTVPGIASIEPFTNAEYNTAISSGLLLASYSSDGSVWFDSGINTLITLSADEDEGWKKIRRVATRFEQFTRIDNALAPLIGKVNCDNDGVALAIQAGQGVLNDMIKEGKLKAGATFYEDPENLHTGDSAWFIVVADDNDSLEKIYTRHEFRFSSNS